VVIGAKMVQGAAGLLEIARVVLSGDAIVVILVLLILGVSLGYICVKAFRYMLSLIIIILLGLFLSVWSLSEHVVSVLAEIKDLALNTLSLLIVLGLLTTGPFSAGFFIGALIALIKK
jgi:hypothetical protein